MSLPSVEKCKEVVPFIQAACAPREYKAPDVSVVRTDSILKNAVSASFCLT